jgi:hypothetical protein
MIAKNNVDRIENMSTFEAVELIESNDHLYNKITAYQFLIDNGMVWLLQGQYGRMAVRLIDDGTCTCGIPIPEPTLDTFSA